MTGLTGSVDNVDNRSFVWLPVRVTKLKRTTEHRGDRDPTL